jgi:Tfp pilus assembly protein PilF
MAERETHNGSWKGPIILGCFFLLVVTVVVYLPALRAGFIWDDNWYVTQNKALRSASGLQDIWFRIGATPQYYPMTFTSFWLEYRLWGLNPAGYHATNVVLHAANAMLVWLLLRRLNVPGAYAAALIFAVHPVHVESVAWITARKNVLSGVFYLSALYVYLRFAGVIASHAAGGSELLRLPDDRTRLYRLAIVLFVLALLSKTVTATLPAAALLLIWWKRGLTRRDWMEALPLLGLGLLAGLVTSYVESRYVGARGPEWDYAPTLLGEAAYRTLVAGRAMWFYAWKLAWPAPLMFQYPRWVIDTGAWQQYLFPAGVLGVIGLLWALRNRLGKGPLVGVLFFVGSLMPASGYFNVFPMRYSWVADHFQYLPSLGLIVICTAGLALLLRGLGRGSPVPGGVVLMAHLFIFGWMANRHALVFDNLLTLWEDTLKPEKNPNSWMAANNYGLVGLQAGDLANAEGWFRKAMRLKPDHRESRYNLARLELLRGNPEKAEEWFREALRIDPAYTDAQFELAELLQRQGRLEEALRAYERVIELTPRHAPAQNAIGVVLLSQDKPAEAIGWFTRAVESDPDSAQGFVNLGTALMRLNRNVNAITAFNQATLIEPDNPIVANNVATLMLANNYEAEAERLLRKAVEVHPRFPDAWTNLGLLELRRGNLDRAVVNFRRALEVDPSFSKAQTGLQAVEEARRNSPATGPSTAPGLVPPGPEPRQPGS